MKKVTILTLHLDYGGIPQYISSLCKMLENEYEIEVIATYSQKKDSCFYFSDKIKITYLIDDKQNREEFLTHLKHKHLWKTFLEGVKSIKLLWLKYSLNKKTIRNLKTDYIITTFPFHSKLVGKQKYSDTIKIATEHNYHNNDEKYVNKIIKSVNNFDYFVLVSKEIESYYQERVSKTKCIYIPNVIDNIPTKNSKLDKNRLISIGRFVKGKGFLDMIDVVAIVKKTIPDIKLYLIGDGEEKELIEKTIENKQLRETIILTGFLNKKEIETYLLKSSLFLMTSHTESFGLVLIEAMSYGIPCLAFDSASGARQVLETSGTLIEKRDKEKMALEIVTMLSDLKKRQKQGAISKSSCQTYLLSNVKQDWLNLLKSK